MYFSYLKEDFPVPQEEKNESKAAFTQDQRSFICTVRPTIHTKPSLKRTELLEIENAAGLLRVLVWTEDILKLEFFENDDITIIK